MNCIECGKSISPKATRCKSCVNLARWSLPDDPRRSKLASRNQAVRGGNFPYEDYEWLRSRYEDMRLTLRQVANEAGCSLRTIARWMDIHGIATRKDAPAESARKCTGPANANWKGKRVCPKCGKRKSSTSETCARCHLATIGGDGNPNWKGGITPENLRQRTSKRYKGWQQAVFERDAYTCQECGDARGGNLNAHHKKPWAKHPELRFDVDNGVTLCEKCHGKAHATPITPSKRQTCGPRRKLTAKERATIRAEAASGEITQRRLAHRYGVSESMISTIIRTKEERHILLWDDTEEP